MRVRLKNLITLQYTVSHSETPIYLYPLFRQTNDLDYKLYDIDDSRDPQMILIVNDMNHLYGATRTLMTFEIDKLVARWREVTEWNPLEKIILVNL